MVNKHQTEKKANSKSSELPEFYKCFLLDTATASKSIIVVIYPVIISQIQNCNVGLIFIFLGRSSVAFIFYHTINDFGMLERLMIQNMQEPHLRLPRPYR